MKIVADDKIPFLKGVLEPFADVVYVNGSKISPDHLRDADALLIRTRTVCNEALLKGSGVKFIGTATIGHDHIDTDWCESNGITWKNAPGCNAWSVRQYITSTLLNLAAIHRFDLSDRVLGVVGVGNVGSKIVRTAELLGMRVYLCDPPKVRETGACGFISLKGILRECDILTFHVPLNREGEDKTWHMIDTGLLSKVNSGTIIINSSRGEVADGTALKSALKSGRIAGVVLDVWENEPDIDTELMAMCDQATPHIAGYSVDGKATGTAMIIHELSRYYDLPLEDWEATSLPEPAEPVIHIDCTGLDTREIIRRAVWHTYDVKADDKRLRMDPGQFEKLRGDYPPRREFGAFTVNLSGPGSEAGMILRKMGFIVL
jgi:erythronate-4-phosphate dehydrogenase